MRGAQLKEGFLWPFKSSLGIFQNEKGTFTSLISFREFQAKQSEKFVTEKFKGSLPSFVAAFCSRKKLSREEIDELKKIIEEDRI